MYKVISVGETNGSATDDIALTRRRHQEGFGIANKLLETLHAHPRLAAYVETLDLAHNVGDRHETAGPVDTNEHANHSSVSKREARG